MNMETQIEKATDIRASSRPSNLDAGLETLADFAQQAQKLEEALSDLSEVTGEKVQRSLLRLKTEISEFEPSVTLLGQVKAGKTSLVNAMAGWADLLPSDVNPWTSVVTSLHLEAGHRQIEKKACFQFMTEGEWGRLLEKGGRIGELAGRAGAEGELHKIRSQIEEMRDRSRRRLGRKFELLMGQKHDYGYFDKNLIERYICLGDDFDEAEAVTGPAEQGSFADITRSADLYLNSKTLPHRLCLRDTPGVNDTFMMREQITLQAIRDSRICIVVLSAGQALSSIDMGLIRMISNLKSREIVIFVNRIDELADPSTQIPEIEDSIRQTLKTHHGPEKAEIIFGSAYWATKALTGSLENMDAASADALINWAETAVTASHAEQPAQNMVWELSGLPTLNKAISERIVQDLGKPLLTRVASSAATAATGHFAAEAVQVEGEDHRDPGRIEEIQLTFEKLSDFHLAELKNATIQVESNFQQRVDRAHATFIERATHALIQHLETNGEDAPWEYDATGLRMLLRSAYSVMSSGLTSTAETHYEAAVQDIAGLLYEGFGPAVEGIQLAIPSVPPAASPVVLGQSIALDFNDGWWASWWRRTRGYKAFAKRFRELIERETEDFLTQLKMVQAPEASLAVLTRLQEFLTEQQDILEEISSRSLSKDDLRGIYHDKAENQKREAAEGALQTLRSFIE